MNKKKFTKLLALYLPYLSMAPPDGAHRRILHHL